MKIGILHHGGKTRKMLTVEVGRASKRDIKFEDEAMALAHIRRWLGLPPDDRQELVDAIKDAIAFIERDDTYSTNPEVKAISDRLAASLR